MKYSDLISFNPIEDVIQLVTADDSNKAREYVKTYIMSDAMVQSLKSPVLEQLQMDEVVDNKGVLVVGNYGTGKSHLMSVISAIAKDADNLQYLQNKKFAEEMECIAGKFEVLRIEIGGTRMSLYDVIMGYTDDLSFRVNNTSLLNGEEKLVILVQPGVYVPYDIRKKCREEEISFETLFPKLNSVVLRESNNLDLDLLTLAYQSDFEEYHERKQTEKFLGLKMYARENVESYLKDLYDCVLNQSKKVKDYKVWFDLAEKKAQIDVMAVEHNVEIDTSELNRIFCAYAMKYFGKLSSEINLKSPVLVSNAMDYIHDHSEKAAIIVMDGMSEFDWTILKRSFTGICYCQSAAFAMIPSTTSISRQCLLSGKYPSQLIEPWKQSKEKNEFYECARKYGYKDNQIDYERGYDASFSAFVKCGAVIILDIDELVHAQYQGRVGMLNDDIVLMKQNKLAGLTKRLLKEGFDVYITADHGNTPCTGLGRLTGSGVEVETRSHKMVVLKNFANKDSLIERYGLLEYPKYYLPKDYDYLICDVGDSLDIKGENVMTHGGISLDEVVVPFIIARTEDYHG